VGDRCKTPTMHMNGGDRAVEKLKNRRRWSRMWFTDRSRFGYSYLGRKVVEEFQVTTQVAARKPALRGRKRLRCTKKWPRRVM